MSQYNISYLLTTYNKKDYLQITLPFFLSHLNDNEELIIYDAESKDGSGEFIYQNIKDKKNVVFCSESDIGEAHGINKCILIAKGRYLKTLSDDDVYHFDTIRKASIWMDNHLNIDWMGSNGCSFFFENQSLQFKNEKPYYERWKLTKKPFLLTGLSYLIRKTSVPKLGLFNTNCKIVDFEYSLRNLSNPKISFALSTLPFYVNIVNPNSNSINLYKHLTNEYLKFQKFYQGDGLLNIYYQFLKMKLMFLINQMQTQSSRTPPQFDFREAFSIAARYLQEYNTKNEFLILD